MAQIHMLISSAVLLMFAIRTLTMPLGDEADTTGSNSTDEQVLEFNFDMGEPENSTDANVPEGSVFKMNCYLQKNESGIITTVNVTREEAGNDTYIGYEEICQFPIATRRLSPAVLASLAG